MAGAVLLAAVVALHAAHPLDEWLFYGFVVLLLLLILARVWQRNGSVEGSKWLDVELGVLLMVAAYASAVHVDGSLDGRYYALIYVAIGVMSAFAKPSSSLVVIVLMMFFEAGVRRFAFGALAPQQLLPHVGFALVFGLLNTLSLRMEVARLRSASRTELQAERDRLQEEARSYRLLRAPSEADQEGDRDQERMLRSGVEEIQLSVLLGLRLLRECLQVHTAMLLWLDADGARLRISELVSDDLELCEGPFSTCDGIFSAVLTQSAPVRLGSLKPNYLLPYYRETCPVQAVCAVPVFEHGTLHGVLVVDRRQAQPFSDAELELVEQGARFAARAIENERVFVQLERTKVEQGKLYRAAEGLGAAINEQEVVDAGVSAAGEIATVDFAAFTAFDEMSGCHQIRAVSGEDFQDLVGERFDDNTGLVSMAVRNRHPLPYRGEFDPSHQLLFSKNLHPPAVPSLVVLPLVVQDQALGALVLGSYEQGAFHEAARSLLEVLASHLAVSLSNARMVRRLEEQATTDGLTGLLNKRALLTTADEKLRSARRFGRRLSILIADIDLFKSVNDTHGHDVGDIVIKGLAQINMNAVRTIDAVARFGGEEFVTICEETDAEGAFQLAERIRNEFANTVFHAKGRTIECTCSFGIATYPDSGESWDKLFEAADNALYASKHGGRNQSTVHEPEDHDHAAA